MFLFLNIVVLIIICMYFLNNLILFACIKCYYMYVNFSGMSASLVSNTSRLFGCVFGQVFNDRFHFTLCITDTNLPNLWYHLYRVSTKITTVLFFTQ